MKGLQNCRAIGGMYFASSVEHVMAVTDSESRPGPTVNLEEIGEVLNRIAAALSLPSLYQL